MLLLFALAVIWGLFEATVFFIIPDVIVTFIGLSGYKRALWGAVWALVGAIIGGTMMYFFGVYQFDWIAGVVADVPAISEEMMESVRLSLESEGLIAMIFGPTKGIPYKIYAIYASSVEIGFAAFVMASIPARFIRFFLTGMMAAFLSQTVFSRLATGVKVTAWVVVWIIVYSIYFSIHPF